MYKCIGQGVNQALEDALLLAQAVRNGGLAEKSLRSFEAQRIPRVQEILAFQIVSPCTHNKLHACIQQETCQAISMNASMCSLSVTLVAIAVTGICKLCQCSSLLCQQHVFAVSIAFTHCANGSC